MAAYKLLVKNAKVILKTVTNAVLNISGIKDLLTGTGSVDSNNKINWTLQEYTNTSANFTSINPVLLLGQKGIETDDLLTTPKFKIGDGVTAWNTLPYFSIGGSSGVQSVTGTNVDNTDPLNPIVNPLGLIQIIDLNGDFFTDLATAQAYLRTYINETIYPITDESFNSGVYFFTVPENTECILLDYFLGDLSTSKTASIIDEFGLISKYGDSAFYRNNGNNTFYNVNFNPSVTTVARSAFRYSTGINQFNNLSLTGTNFFGFQSVGKFIIKGNIGSSESANYTASFFGSSTSTILARSEKYTSNAGAIQGDLQTAISNGCNVQFDGINLVTLNTNQTLTNKTFDSPTITVGGITVSSTELSYLDSATSNIQTQLNSKTKIVGFNTADALTPANTSNNVIKSITIPANTYTDGNVLRLFGGGDKIGTAGTITVRIYANTVNNLTGTPILMAQSVFTNTNLTFQMDRNLFVRSTTTWGYASNVNNSMGFLASSTINSNDLAIDWTVTQYIIIAIQLANGADQVNVKVFAVVNF